MTTIVEDIQKYCIGITNKLKSGPSYVDRYFSLTPQQINTIRSEYKVIDVKYLDHDILNMQMINDKYFYSNPEKIQVVNSMLEYYQTNSLRPIYEKTDYLCNKKEKICICNVNAHNLRKI